MQWFVCVSTNQHYLCEAHQTKQMNSFQSQQTVSFIFWFADHALSICRNDCLNEKKNLNAARLFISRTDASVQHGLNAFQAALQEHNHYRCVLSQQHTARMWNMHHQNISLSYWNNTNNKTRDCTFRLAVCWGYMIVNSDFAAEGVFRSPMCRPPMGPVRWRNKQEIGGKMGWWNIK